MEETDRMEFACEDNRDLTCAQFAQARLDLPDDDAEYGGVRMQHHLSRTDSAHGVFAPFYATR